MIILIPWTDRTQCFEFHNRQGVLKTKQSNRKPRDIVWWMAKLCEQARVGPHDQRSPRNTGDWALYPRGTGSQSLYSKTVEVSTHPAADDTFSSS